MSTDLLGVETPLAYRVAFNVACSVSSEELNKTESHQNCGGDKEVEITQKVEDAYVQRMSNDLKARFLALSADERAAIIKALVRVHHVIEEETFELLFGILSARADKK